MDGTLNIGIVHLWNRQRHDNFQLCNSLWKFYQAKMQFRYTFHDELSGWKSSDLFLFHKWTDFHLWVLLVLCPCLKMSFSKLWASLLYSMLWKFIELMYMVCSLASLLPKRFLTYIIGQIIFFNFLQFLVISILT